MNLKDLEIYEIPTIKLTQSINKITGTISFIFSYDQIQIFIKKTNRQMEHLSIKINHNWIWSNHIQIVFHKGKPFQIYYIFLIKNKKTWSRFLTFLKKYAEKNNLLFSINFPENTN